MTTASPAPVGAPPAPIEPTYEPINPVNVEPPEPETTVEFPPEDIRVDPLPEAGGIAWTNLYTSDGVQVNVTARDHTPRGALDQLMGMIMYAQARYGLTGKTQIIQAPGSAPQTPGSASAPIGGQTHAKGEYGGEIIAKVIEFKTRDDGKVSVSFFAENHKFSDLNFVRTLPNALEMLSKCGNKWTEKELKSNMKFSVNYRVKWEYGDTNSKGNQYHNVSEVLPA